MTDTQSANFREEWEDLEDSLKNWTRKQQPTKNKQAKKQCYFASHLIFHRF